MKQVHAPSTPQVPKPDAVPAIQADVLGEKTFLQTPAVPAEHDRGRAAQTLNDGEPKPTQDENQPGFIGERNLPHS